MISRALRARRPARYPSTTTILESTWTATVEAEESDEIPPTRPWERVSTLTLGRGLLPARCDIVRFEDGQMGVLKTFSGSGPLRRVLGRVAVQRERRAYERLDGLTGVPRLLGVVAGDALLFRYIAGVPVSDANLADPQDFTQRFERLLSLIHARGVSHGEIRLAHVLADGAGQPWLVDFATATVTNPARPSAIFRLQQRLDRFGWLTIKERLLSGILTPAERQEQQRNRLLASVFRHNVT
jgi:hypothetical protein